MSQIYVVGGQQQSLRPLMADTNNWYSYQKGLILQVDSENNTVQTLLEYVSPPDACAAGDPILFKSGTRAGNRLYLCTQTELLIYELPTFTRVGYVSLPRFNDVHHVNPTPRGTLLVANSGLETILEVTLDGVVVNEWNVLGEDTWARFSPHLDYRHGINTKPHRSHPNYVFQVGDEVWATRFHQHDALCVTDPTRRIAIADERVHDGVVHAGRVYFTTVNGRIVVANPRTLRVEDMIDLTTMHPADTLLGWCRSLLFEERRVWVGFSRIRPTKFRENVGWVAHGFRRVLPTHIACYDLDERRCVSEIDLEPYGLNAVFGIYPT